jgi:hypothetical protein
VAWALAALALAALLCFVPLFDLIGYELSLAVTPLAATAAIQLGLREVARRRGGSFSAREAADHQPLRALVAATMRALVRVVAILLIPLVVLGLNGLRVRNCNPGVGLLWYAVLPLGSAAYGALLGVALGVTVPAATRPRASLAVALLVMLVALGWSLWRLYFAPPIFVFDPLFGYFAGSLYDEHVAIPNALWWARGYHLALASAIVALAAVALDGHALALRARAMRGRRRLAALALVLSILAVVAYRLGPRFGYRHDAKTIAAALGGQRLTEHFVLHYRPDGPYGTEIGDVANELELRYARLAELLGIVPPIPVHAYLFASAAEKQALMGAGHTYIAKPWRHEIYVNHEAFPEPVLGHELAHVFGASVGDPLLGLARRGLRLDVGLIEGLAEATTWHGGALTADEVVRVLDLLGRRPALDRVMSPAFWSLPSQQAYAIAGSFCRFLMVHNGVRALLALYHAGGDRGAYPSIFGANFGALEAEWLAKVREVEIAPGTLERERDRILRPSIFHRPCARELARLIDLARSSAGAGDHARARSLYERVCTDEPDDPAHLEDLLGEALRDNAEREVRQVAARLFAHPKASASQRGAAHAALGDLAARAHREGDAAIEYAVAERAPSDEATARLYTVKRLLAERLTASSSAPRALSLALAALSQPTDAAEDYTRITRASAALPDDALLAYLAARQLHARKLDEGADDLLRRALAGPLPDARFVREAERLRADIAFRRRDFATAASRYDGLAQPSSPAATAASRIDASQWADRARFFAEHQL